MKFIKKAEIQLFRSIKDAVLDEIGNFSVFAGLNNSGKSNFLRALNVFFNNVVEEGVPLNIKRDYYRPEVRSKKKKEISIKVTFELPTTFKFRAKLESAEKLLGRDFAIKKVWGQDSAEPRVFLNDSTNQLNSENVDIIAAFLNLINFRYIPNRVIPTDLILKEQQALRDVLIRRLARYKKQSEAVFQEIQRKSGVLVEVINSEIRKMAPDISQVRLATASSLADLAFKFGYRLQEESAEMEDIEQGSGMQSLLLFQTLHLIDRDYFQKFGWKQAAIWAVEEPESSLHTAFEAQIANFLSRIAKDVKGRLQILATTHSDIMIQYSDKGYFVDKQKATNTVTRKGTFAQPEEPQNLVKISGRSGVSRFVDPILYYPLDSLVLVEGKFDRDFIIEALRVLRLVHSYKIISLEDLTGIQGKGGSELLPYIESHTDAIASRNKVAPVIVVLDWDQADKVEKYRKPLRGIDTYKVLVWNENEANPKLDGSFGGIERFFSDRIIDEAAKLDSRFIATKSDGTKVVHPKEYGNLKQLLNKVVKGGLVKDDVIYSEKFIRTLHETANGKFF